ncbi:MAG: hypothetical protein IPM45_16310 [Acidimicrobiales bacterium]|nr:hypothetical protein [Acidimicrobiales bacterium]
MTTADRWVLLGLARPRAPWFREVAHLATSGAVPAEFVKCLSPDELRARVASGRPWSAALVDGGLPAVDRDLVRAATGAGVAVLVVADPAAHRDWPALGAAAVLPPGFGRGELVAALRQHARRIGRHDLDPPGAQPRLEAGWRGHLVAVTGPGGSGASTVAAAAAQGLAARPGGNGGVLLADLCLPGAQAMLHDAVDLVPGLPELVAAHRGGPRSTDEIRSFVFTVDDRGYHLLLGLRRHRDWTVLRPGAVEAAILGLARAYRTVVADVDADLEGQDEVGSVEVEERNVLARTTLPLADAVLAVGTPTLAGVHGIARVVTELAGHGIEPGRILPVVNLAPRNPRERARIARAVADLCGPALPGGQRLPGCAFLPWRRRVEDAHRAGGPLPAPLPDTLAGAVVALLDRVGPATVPAPVPVAPGSLGALTGLGAGGR